MSSKAVSAAVTLKAVVFNVLLLNFQKIVDYPMTVAVGYAQSAHSHAFCTDVKKPPEGGFLFPQEPAGLFLLAEFSQGGNLRCHHKQL